MVKRGLTVVELNYGPDSNDPRPYHGPEHTSFVTGAASVLADQAIARGSISASQKSLLRIAASYHDVVNDKEAEDNEMQSAVIAARHMRMLTSFSESQVRQVVEAILATKVKEAAPDHIVQSADESNYLGMLLADADLSALGSPVDIFWPVAQRFFAESQPEQPLAGEALRQFAQDQIALVGGHSYYTQEARQTFNHQPEIIEFLQTMFAK
jgi:predicted metal-dependent HD superfamily phosphohydrolase